ncbi:DUF4326 domain-containing protein [Marinobacterium sp. BA1]|uniref:A1S_2505 family phage non-structural protein n=1 Tax=Marinobacterium sp. BA1 TaxID=3138931 RepID=UPI0032E5A93F
MNATTTTVSHCKRDKADIYIGRGSRFGNPFPMTDESERAMVIEQFRQWVRGQPELLRLSRELLPGKSLGCYCAPRDCHGDVLAEIANGHWDNLIPDSPVFCFGSNEAGRHGAGDAKTAIQHHGAVAGQGIGLAGDSYAVPTMNRMLRALPLATIKHHIADLIECAQAMPERTFMVTRIGCGLAGFTDDDIAPLFYDAPPNMQLPGIWEAMRSRANGIPAPVRVIVAGSRTFKDYALLLAKLDHLLQRLPKAHIGIISDGADTLGERYAVQRGLRLRRMPAFWESYGKAADYLRNQQMSHYATHLVAFWNGYSPDTQSMIDIAQRDKLAIKIVKA